MAPEPRTTPSFRPHVFFGLHHEKFGVLAEPLAMKLRDVFFVCGFGDGFIDGVPVDRIFDVFFAIFVKVGAIEVLFEGFL